MATGWLTVRSVRFRVVALKPAPGQHLPSLCVRPLGPAMEEAARGDVIVVRFADDFVVGFQHRVEAERFLAELRERFMRFGLEPHPEKTDCSAGHARRNRADRHRGAPGTFNFLGFTHSCGKTRKGGFTVLRQTMRARWQGKLRELKAELRQRLHEPIQTVGAYLRSVVFGHVRYYGVPMNGPAIGAFRFAVIACGGTTCVVAVRAITCPGVVCAAPAYHVASARAHLSSLSPRAPGRHHPRWEPDAVMPLVRICGGGVQRWAFLLQLTMFLGGTAARAFPASRAARVSVRGHVCIKTASGVATERCIAIWAQQRDHWRRHANAR